MSRAVIYCRVSTAGQEENTSLETQEKDARAYCTGRGYSVAAVFKDVHTGAEINRPGLHAAIDAIKDGTANVLVVHKLDRLSRNQTHQGVIFYWVVEQSGARIESVTEEIDNSPQGQLLRAVAAMVAEVERQNTKERTHRGKRARAERGSILPGSFPLFGYMWADEQHTAFIPDEETAPIVRRMFKEIAEGVLTPSQYWMSKGIYSANRKIGTRWGQSVIHKILRNPAYKGQYAAFRYKRENGRVISRTANDPARIPLPPSVCPPLVESALWETVHRQLGSNQLHAYRNARNPELALLSRGFVFCGHCGHPMQTEYQASLGRAYYTCRRYPSTYATPCEHRPHIAAGPLDAAVLARIAELAQQPDAVRQAAEQARQHASEERAEIQQQINALEKLIARDTAGLTNLMSALEETEGFARNVLTQRINELGKQIQAAQAELETLQRALDTAGDTLLLEKGLLLTLQQIADAPYDWKRDILHALGIFVTVYATGHPLGRWRLRFKWTGINESVLFFQRQGVQHGD